MRDGLQINEVTLDDKASARATELSGPKATETK
jgi:hypothetical protein